MGKRSSKRVFLESPLRLCPLKASSVLRANLKGGREEPDSPKTHYWTTVSPHNAFSAPLARSDRRKKATTLAAIVTYSFPGGWTMVEAEIDKLVTWVSEHQLSPVEGMAMHSTFAQTFKFHPLTPIPHRRS